MSSALGAVDLDVPTSEAGSTTVQRARMTMVLAHAVMATFWVLQAVIGVPFMDAKHRLAALVMLGAVAAIQVRHSAAASRGAKPAGWWWSLAVLLVIVVAPQWWLGGVWATTTWAAVASALMLLPRRLAYATGVCLVAFVWPSWVWMQDVVDLTGVQLVVDLCYFVVVYFGGGVALWGSVELYRVIRQLDATATSIGELAVARERLRQAADVHDLLGQNLTAIGLRASVGRRLAADDPDAARREASAVVDLAARALGDLRAAAHGDRAMRLADELDGATTLLRAGGVDVRVTAASVDLEPEVETVLAWCLREASTNVIRHAAPTWCTIELQESFGRVGLRVANDGAGHGLRPGNGLRGMAERADSIGGRASWALQEEVVTVHVDVPHARRMTDVIGRR